VEISLTNVVKRFGENVILDGVTLSVTAGETVALIGPSGGGKSTLLRCLNGLVTFDDGEVQVGAHPLRPGPHDPATLRAVRLLVGMVFQDFRLFPHLTALGNITLAPMKVLGQSKKEATERAQELLTKVGLGDRGNAYPIQLSGGQQQRVAIARALAMQPRILLCDEITSALDPELKWEVLETVAGLKREGITVLAVTHEIGFARRAADRVFVLAGGKVIEEGPPSEVIDRPQTERTQQFLERVMA
jgi:ABC-type polar amino acid transport system ATPase subunit